MTEIGIRELKARASEFVQNVRKKRSRYIITYRGRPVGLLSPLESTAPTPAESHQAAGEAWAELERLGAENGRKWQSKRTSAELLSEMRCIADK
jgi:prevent-host-death family protein